MWSQLKGLNGQNMMLRKKRKKYYKVIQIYQCGKGYTAIVKCHSSSVPLILSPPSLVAHPSAGVGHLPRMTRRRHGQGQLICWSATGYIPWSCSQSSPVRPRQYCGSYSSLAPLLRLIRIPSCAVIHCSHCVFSSSPPGFTCRSSFLPSSLTTSQRYVLPQLPNLRSSILENKHPWILHFESCSQFCLCAGVQKHIPSITVKAVGALSLPQWEKLPEKTWNSGEPYFL